MANTTLDPKNLIFSGTAAHRGRTVAVTPKNSELAHLCYGRIRLDSTSPRAAFETNERETALMCMKGTCRVTVGGTGYDLDTYDAIYIPRGSAVEVTTTSEVDLVECAADVTGDYPLQIVRYAEIKKDPALKFTAGGAATTRDLNIIIGNNVRAGRILAGFTRSLPGNWTSWPPHEHTKLLEEVYVYFDMPPPAFGIQLVYTQPDKPRVRQRGARRRRRADAGRVSPQRRGARPQHQLHLDDGGPPRGRGSPVRRRQRSARLRPGGFGARGEPQGLKP